MLSREEIQSVFIQFDPMNLINEEEDSNSYDRVSKAVFRYLNRMKEPLKLEKFAYIVQLILGNAYCYYYPSYEYCKEISNFIMKKST